MEKAEEDLLVLAAQGGDRKAFEHLFAHYHQPLLRFAFRLGQDRQMAADAVQDCWVTLARSLKSLKDPRAFRLWLYRTVRWRLLDLLRARGQAPVALDAVELRAEPAVSEIATTGQLKAHMAGLGEDDRLTMTLFYLEEMTLAEIAVILEVPLGTVKSRLNRARNQLRNSMTGDVT